MLRYIGTVLVGLAVLTTFGCGSKKSLDTVSVSGTVTLDGTPVQGATVSFVPTGGGRAASGTTDASGSYKLTTQDPNDGALVGSYAVTVSKFEAGGSPASAIKPGMTPEEMQRAAYSSEAYKKAKGGPGAKTGPQFNELLPVKYQNPTTSGFKADVAKDSQNEFNFELSSK